MKLAQTARIKLKDVSASEVLPTLSAYTKAFNYVCQVGFEKKIDNRADLHKLVYYNIREFYNLPSQLAISCIKKALEAVKSTLTKTKFKKLGSCPSSRLCSIRLDKNSYTLFMKNNIVSILTLDKRKKFTLNISEHHQVYFDSWENTSADLCIKGSKVYLHISFQKDIPNVKSNNNFIGLDRGINNIAVTSDNHFYGGGSLKNQINKYRRLRNKLQSKGTKSAKRHLKRLSHKEKRFRADQNHIISKQIISKLSPGDTLVLEDLTGIRGNRRLRKEMRTLINNWSFFQLEQFLTYKAKAKSIKVVYVDPAYTSQRCSSCGHTEKANRKKHNFSCQKCQFTLNSDLNASRNIRRMFAPPLRSSRNICIKALGSYTLPKAAVINQPIVATTLSRVSYKPLVFSQR